MLCFAEIRMTQLIRLLVHFVPVITKWTKCCEIDRFQFYSRHSMVYARVLLLFTPYRYIFTNILSSYVDDEYVHVGCNANILGEFSDSISSHAETGTTPDPNIDDSSKYSVIQNFYIEICFTGVWKMSRSGKDNCAFHVNLKISCRILLKTRYYLWGVDVEEQAVLVTYVSFFHDDLHVGAHCALGRCIANPFPCFRRFRRLK